MSKATGPEVASPARDSLEFGNNRLLPMLYGPHDSHLARIETALGVHLANRGNRVLLSGEEAAIRIAAGILKDLYRRIEAGEEIGVGDVEGALRLSGAIPGIAPATRARQAGDVDPADLHRITTRNRVIQPRSRMQGVYIEALRRSVMTFGIGPAGTGKTYLAVAMAVSRMLAGEVDRIVLSRPAVEAGENLGFLPGDLKEKVDPYLRPLYDALYDMMPAEQVEKRLMSGQIEVAPLAYMRGRTLSHACVILDEAQNTTPMQMKMFLTRLGENARMTICGDPSQVDLPEKTESGLAQALRILEGVEGIATVRFSERDVVRHPLVARIVEAYDRQTGREARGRGAAENHVRRPK
ncbi:MAG: PhoH family protein [Rhodothalassiaceae bacterium]